MSKQSENRCNLYFLGFLKTGENRKTSIFYARVEYGGKEGEKLSEKILEKLNQNSSKALDLTVIDNPKLIAGCKIRLGDDVYENSISDRLNKLQKTFL